MSRNLFANYLKSKDVGNISYEDIERYNQGLMSASERNSLERAALEDPFLADAMEGFTNTPVDLAADMKELKEKYMTIRISESLLNQLRKEAAKNTRTIAAQVLHFVKQGLEKK